MDAMDSELWNSSVNTTHFAHVLELVGVAFFSMRVYTINKLYARRHLSRDPSETHRRPKTYPPPPVFRPTGSRACPRRTPTSGRSPKAQTLHNTISIPYPSEAASDSSTHEEPCVRCRTSRHLDDTAHAEIRSWAKGKAAATRLQVKLRSVCMCPKTPMSSTRKFSSSIGVWKPCMPFQVMFLEDNQHRTGQGATSGDPLDKDPSPFSQKDEVLRRPLSGNDTPLDQSRLP